MKTAFLLLAGLLMRGLQPVTAQIDTTNGRYCRPVFPNHDRDAERALHSRYVTQARSRLVSQASASATLDTAVFARLNPTRPDTKKPPRNRVAFLTFFLQKST